LEFFGFLLQFVERVEPRIGLKENSHLF
jgi:hypothetical protein